jgi:Zn-dependent M28 family amino/carboxypeptidase
MTLCERLRRHVEVLAEEVGERNLFHYPNLRAAAHYIRTQWESLGYQVRSQNYLVHGVPCENLEVLRPGESPGPWIVLGAHYDTAPGTPGANDNASGIAAVLELSRWLAEHRPRHPFRCVAFTNEEPPFFYGQAMGSRVYARSLREEGISLHFMISLETMGFYTNHPGSQRYPPLLRYFYPHQGNFIAFVSDLRSRGVLKRLVRSFRRHSRTPAEAAALPKWIPGVGWSDHLSFWQAGYRALMITDTAFYRYSHYHRPSDRACHLDYQTLAEVVRALAETLAEWEP